MTEPGPKIFTELKKQLKGVPRKRGNTAQPSQQTPSGFREASYLVQHEIDFQGVKGFGAVI